MASELDNLPDTDGRDFRLGIAGIIEYRVYLRDYIAKQRDEIKAECRELMSDEIPQSHLAFLWHYLTPGRGQSRPANAAKLAGLSPVTGWQLRARYDGLIRQWMEDVGYSPGKIKAEVARMFNAKKTMFFQDKGVVTDERTIEDNASILKALELASKHQGMMVDKVDHGEIKVTINAEVIPRK